ncbi:MAG: MFS transporter, partial [Bacteroidales bacterium]
GASASKIGITMSIMSLTTAITSTQIGHLKKIYSHKQLLFFSIASYLVALIIIPLSYHYWSIILGIIIFGIGHGLMTPNFQTMLVSYATINERAAFMSVNAMVLRIGQTVGPLLIGICYSMGNLRTSFFGGAAMAVIMFFVLIFFIQEPPKSE